MQYLYCKQCNAPIKNDFSCCPACGATSDNFITKEVNDTSKNPYAKLIPALQREDLQCSIKDQLLKLDKKQQQLFYDEYSRKQYHSSNGFLCWFLLGTHYAYLGKWGFQIMLWLSCFAYVGFLWWIIDLFRIPSIVEGKNDDIAFEILRDVKIVAS